MAAEIFNFKSGSSPVVSETPTIAAISGQFARIRFTKRTANVEVSLVIDANGLESESIVDEPRIWASGALADGDNIKLRVRLNRDETSEVNGVLEVTQ